MSDTTPGVTEILQDAAFAMLAAAPSPAEAKPSQTSGADVLASLWACQAWGDGSSVSGFTNVVCPDCEVVIAVDQPIEIAVHIAALHNSALAKPASEPAGGGVREAAAALLADLDRSLVFAKDDRIISATNASVKRLRAALSSPASSSPAETEALPAGVEAVAWLKEWQSEGEPRRRVDLTPDLEPWMAHYNARVTPLYASAPAQAFNLNADAMKAAVDAYARSTGLRAPEFLGDAISAYLKALPSAEAVGGLGWQDIGTAPRDGSRILATGGGLGNQIDFVSYSNLIGCWNAAEYTLDDRDDEAEGYSRPTHWMPLPPRPCLATPAEGGRYA